ncbi:MAG: hypothetical protein V7739_19225 [Motiliproteus sp.]
MSEQKQDTPNRSIFYHILMGLGFLVLISWFYLMREVGFMTWLSAKGPETHKGAMNMLAIMIWMLPAFLCWKYYLRYINRKLKIRGIYYEDHYYGTTTDDNSTKNDNTDASDKQGPIDK